MGGSFNPAHAGHLAISHEALRRLDLDQVWWLVSPANPLKDPSTLAPVEIRLTRARRLVGRDRRIRVLAIEGSLGLRYTADTVELLADRMRGTRFVWLMGADNLAQFTRWRRFADIARTVALAILDRPHYSISGLNAKFAARFRHGRLKTGALKALATAPTPAWAFLVIPLHAESATAIRRECGGRWWAGRLMP
ncbi:MAG: nicotinate (nicotinamide) nucleotide adenylyltransferase [Alphaproteobacteria bacterium]|nr:MAG: nicotinate (nicotinamide) nucleotide adenylyltransferase [Alphaproteobacteria bacterium]